MPTPPPMLVSSEMPRAGWGQQWWQATSSPLHLHPPSSDPGGATGWGVGESVPRLYWGAALHCETLGGTLTALCLSFPMAVGNTAELPLGQAWHPVTGEGWLQSRPPTSTCS